MLRSKHIKKEVNMIFDETEKRDYDEELRKNLISMIESLTGEEIIRRLERAGIRRGDYRAYSRAKRQIFRGMFINGDIYDKQIQVVIDYVNGEVNLPKNDHLGSGVRHEEN